MHHTQAVLFDLGNTLVSYYTRAEFPSVLRKCIASALAVSDNNPALAENLLAKALELNREDATYAVNPLSTRLRTLIPGCADAPAEHDDRVARAFMQPIFDCARLEPAAASVLDVLRERGIRTAIVSNAPWGSPASFWRDELQRHGLLHRVDAVVFCVDVGFRKPHEAPIRRALDLLNVSPKSTYFVGDDPRWDVEGARRAGVQPILLTAAAEAAGSDCLVVRQLQQILDVIAPSDVTSHALDGPGDQT
jgi:putative hydrolase of the HAD superfamily